MNSFPFSLLGPVKHHRHQTKNQIYKLKRKGYGVQTNIADAGEIPEAEGRYHAPCQQVKSAEPQVKQRHLVPVIKAVDRKGCAVYAALVSAHYAADSIYEPSLQPRRYDDFVVLPNGQPLDFGKHSLRTVFRCDDCHCDAMVYEFQPGHHLRQVHLPFWQTHSGNVIGFEYDSAVYSQV